MVVAWNGRPEKVTCSSYPSRSSQRPITQILAIDYEIQHISFVNGPVLAIRRKTKPMFGCLILAPMPSISSGPYYTLITSDSMDMTTGRGNCPDRHTEQLLQCCSPASSLYLFRQGAGQLSNAASLHPSFFHILFYVSSFLQISGRSPLKCSFCRFD